jgi:hypothetical protein
MKNVLLRQFLPFNVTRDFPASTFATLRGLNPSYACKRDQSPLSGKAQYWKPQVTTPNRLCVSGELRLAMHRSCTTLHCVISGADRGEERTIPPPLPVTITFECQNLQVHLFVLGSFPVLRGEGHERRRVQGGLCPSQVPPLSRRCRRLAGTVHKVHTHRKREFWNLLLAKDIHVLASFPVMPEMTHYCTVILIWMAFNEWMEYVRGNPDQDNPGGYSPWASKISSRDEARISKQSEVLKKNDSRSWTLIERTRQTSESPRWMKFSGRWFEIAF